MSDQLYHNGKPIYPNTKQASILLLTIDYPN